MSAKQFHASKREYVYMTLREEILGGVLPPDARLVIDDTAARLGVSPIPVREALQELQHDGLVNIEPYVGAHVASIHAGLIEEVFAILEAMEVISGQHACVHMSDDDLDQVARMLEKMDEHVHDLERWSNENVELHRFICRRAQLTLVPTIMEQALDNWQRLRRHYLDDVFARRVEIAQQEHWELCAALRTRDPAVVGALIRSHNRNALAAYLNYLTQQGHLNTPTIHRPGREES